MDIGLVGEDKQVLTAHPKLSENVDRILQLQDLAQFDDELANAGVWRLVGRERGLLGGVPVLVLKVMRDPQVQRFGECRCCTAYLRAIRMYLAI